MCFWRDTHALRFRRLACIRSGQDADALRKRLGDEERELENARRERDAVRASGHGGGTGDGAVERDALKASGGDGAVESAPGDCGDVAELDTEVRADSRRLKGACFLCITQFGVASLFVWRHVSLFVPAITPGTVWCREVNEGE